MKENIQDEKALNILPQNGRRLINLLDNAIDPEKARKIAVTIILEALERL